MLVPAAPITLVNLFKLADTACYPDGSAVDGGTALARHSAAGVSVLERVGGRFLPLEPSDGGLVGAGEGWDLNGSVRGTRRRRWVRWPRRGPAVPSAPGPPWTAPASFHQRS
ncbi:hypothetical protein [Nocardiopsis sp. LOL_012]|uniref:hypothetical protein n=1 Tax=Nocardiopsis sp. LOL_012 TaxID=3345409 RepID=UPI003A87F3A8